MQCLPPSIGTCAPVMKEESSEARNAIIPATSDTSPGRPNAWVNFVLSRNYKTIFISLTVLSIVCLHVPMLNFDFIVMLHRG